MLFRLDLFPRIAEDQFAIAFLAFGYVGGNFLFAGKRNPFATGVSLFVYPRNLLLAHRYLLVRC